MNGIRLETMHCGSGLATTKSAVFRFFKRLSDPQGTSAALTLRQRQREYEAADKRLAAGRI